MNRDDAPPRLLSRRRGAAPVSTTPRSANKSAVFTDEAGPSTSTTPAAWGSASFGAAAPAASAAAVPTFGSLKWTAPTPAAQAPVAPPASAFGAGSAQPSYAFAPAAGAAAAAPAPPAIGQTGSGLGRFMRARESPGPAAGPSGGITSLSGGRNAMGAAVEFDAERKQRFDSSSANRYPELKVQREAARERYIRLGVLPDPSKALDLAAASNLRGTCMDMCPAFEIAEREHQNEGDALEMVSGSSRIDPDYAVKIYRRPAAGRELPLPDDIRPPAVLRRTLDYLFHTMLPASPDEPEFANVQGFIWNRTRAVRQDFIVQGQSSPLTIECHERIARYHILCLHWKGGRGAEEWSEQQELEQLRKTVRSLTEFYADMRASCGRSAPNEAEFRAYSLMLHHRDPDTLREVEHLPAPVFDAPILQAALRLRGYAQGAGPDKPRGGAEGSPNLWSRFFKEVRGPNVPYLLACLAENIFPVVRAGAARAMESAYMAQHAPMPVDELQSVLATDDAQETLEFAKSRGYIEVSAATADAKQSVAFSIGRGQEKRPLTDADIAKGKESPFSESLVEAKRGSWTCQEVVDGVASGAIALLDDDLGQPLPPLFHPPRQVARRASAAARANASHLQQLPQQPDPWSGPSNWAPVAKAAAPAPSPAAQAFAARVAAASAPPPAVARQAAKASISPAQNPPATSSASVWGTSKPQLGSASGSSSGSAPAPAAKATTAAARVAASPYNKPTSSSSAPSFISFKAASAPTAANGTSNGAAPKAKANRTSDAPGEAAAVFVAAPSAVATDGPPSLGAGPAKKSKKADDATSSLLATPLVSAATRQRTEEASKAAELALARREEDTRAARVEAAVQGLLDEGVEEVLALKLEEAAEYAAAATLRGRALFRATLRVWTARLEERRARADETRRLDHVRQDLKRRALGRSTAGEEAAEESWGKRSILYGEAHAQQARTERVPATSAAARTDDSALQQQLADAKTSRDELWAPGTWLDALVQRLEDVTPPSGQPRHVRSWDVTLDTAGSGASSQWLRSKLDLERPGFDNRLGPRRRDLRVFIEAAETALPFQETLGLVIFERSPQRDARDAARLRRLREGVAAAPGVFVPWLLVVAWTEAPSDADVLKELGCGHGDVWAGVSVMRLADADDQTDSNFKAQLERLVTSIVWTEDARRVPVTRLSDQLLEPLGSALHCLEDLLRRLSATRAPSSDKERRLAARVFATVVVLLNDATESVVQVCIEASDEMYGDLPDVRLPPFDWQASPDTKIGVEGTLYRRVAEYLDEADLLAAFPQNASLALLTSMLATAETQQQPFPLAACGEQLFEVTVAALQESGARVDEEAELEFRHAARRFAALADEAVKELVEEERSLRRTRRIASSQSSTSISSGTAPTLGKRSAAKALAATETSTSPAKKFRASASVSAAAPSTAVASLRALMADVEHLIEGGARE